MKHELDKHSSQEDSSEVYSSRVNHIQALCGNYNYKEMLETTFRSLALQLRATDREVLLFEGDTALDKVLPKDDVRVSAGMGRWFIYL